MKKFVCVCLIIATILTLTACGAGKTDAYPSRNIEFVVPFGAGGSADIFARSFADLLAKETKVNVTVNNKEGAGGVTGMTYAGEQDNDGYTIALVTPSMPIAEVKGKLDFQKDWIPIACMEQDIYVISVLDSNKKFTDWDSFVAYAKANPGDVTTGGSGAGSLDECVATQFGSSLGTTLTYVPYSGYGEYKTAFLGGEVDLYIDKLSSYSKMAQYSEIKPMAVTSETKVATAGLDNVPSVKELGVDFTAGSWRGIVVKTGTPENVITTLSNLCEKIYKSDEFQAVLKTDSADVVYGYKSAADFKTLIASEVVRFNEVINGK